MRPRILLVDNDLAHLIRFAEAFVDASFEVDVAEGPSECISKLKRRRYDAVVVDQMMPHSDEFTRQETSDGLRTGLALARWIRRESPTARIICLAVFVDEETASWFSRFGSGAFIKGETSPHALVRHVERLLAAAGRRGSFKAFIVHGRAPGPLDELTRWLKRTGRCPRPIVLKNEPSLGATVIEKFELHAGDVDVVFVLLTGDDRGGPKASSRAKARQRARQNVVFELGYFYGRLRRSSGRIIVLRKGHIELPSDLHGLATIDISSDFRAALPALRNELRALIQAPSHGEA
jgi:predicted nucleotide-binding protein